MHFGVEHTYTSQGFFAGDGELARIEECRVVPCFFEHQPYEVLIEKKSADLALEFYHESAALRQAVRKKGEMTLSGVLNFRNEVGYTDFEIRIGGETVLSVRLEVFPSKLDYRKDYREILQDVNEQVHNLAFDFLRRTYQLTGLKETSSQSLTEFFSILRAIFDDLVKAVERIEKMPHHRRVGEDRVVVADRVKRAGGKMCPISPSGRICS